MTKLNIESSQLLFCMAVAAHHDKQFCDYLAPSCPSPFVCASCFLLCASYIICLQASVLRICVVKNKHPGRFLRCGACGLTFSPGDFIFQDFSALQSQTDP